MKKSTGPELQFTSDRRNVYIAHLFLQKGGFPHSLGSFFLSSSLLLFLPPPLFLYQTLSLSLLSSPLLCPLALQFFSTPPGHIRKCNNCLILFC